MCTFKCIVHGYVHVHCFCIYNTVEPPLKDTPIMDTIIMKTFIMMKVRFTIYCPKQPLYYTSSIFSTSKKRTPLTKIAGPKVSLI